MSNGKLTANVARSLQQEFNQQGFDVLHDHGQKENDSPGKLGKLRSWSGPSLKSETVLADLDIAIISRDDKKIYALIEIEETTDKPKVILGDVLATLLGNGIAFQGKDLQVGKWTTLILMVHGTHLDRLAFLTEQISLIKLKLKTPNATIGRIIIDTYSKELQLVEKLRKHISEVVIQPTL